MNRDTQDTDVFADFKTRLGGFGVGAVIALLVSASLVALIMLGTNPPLSPSVPSLLVWAGVGGFFGGAARAMFRFILQLNNRKSEEVKWRLNRWFLYLLKPFVGLSGGVLFFLLGNLGLVSLFAQSAPKNDFLHVVLTSSVGGLFFEDVFAVLQRLFPSDEETGS